MKLTKMERITLTSIAGKYPRVIDNNEAVSLSLRRLVEGTSSAGYTLTPAGLRALAEQEDK